MNNARIQYYLFNVLSNNSYNYLGPNGELNYATADMPIPMVADCSDYETYRSGQYVPGIMGTLFSLVDKLVSSLGSTIVGAAVAMIGIQTLPDSKTP